jgi:hypothetical protein
MMRLSYLPIADQIIGLDYSSVYVYTCEFML